MTREQKKKMVEEFLAKPENLTEWFTELLSGDRIHQYVVAFTNNKEWTVDLLVDQREFYWMIFENITLWWRFNSQGIRVVDIGTSVDDLGIAHFLKARHNQECIRDFVNREEVF